MYSLLKEPYLATSGTDSCWLLIGHLMWPIRRLRGGMGLHYGTAITPYSSDVPESFLSSQSWFRVTSPRVRVGSESSKIFSNRVRVRVMTWSSRVRVESLRVIGLQARVNVEWHDISRFFYNIFFAMKWRPIS